MKRFQSRSRGGRFTRNTPENTLGLHIPICSKCRALNPHEVGTPAPAECHSCGAPLEQERVRRIEPRSGICECGHERAPWHPRDGGCMEMGCGCQRFVQEGV